MRLGLTNAIYLQALSAQLISENQPKMSFSATPFCQGGWGIFMPFLYRILGGAEGVGNTDTSPFGFGSVRPPGFLFA
ncbi:hypothetical protein [Cyclobacterium marinum]|uniref:hypothetical protein n=1 Tax=Cyclobacterium marinum TaxID=104 RepID=UPI0030DC6C1E|tara:strand:- start:183 stop:413 length:231 start_codon:yes stop_codon:yes gene_type:complete